MKSKYSVNYASRFNTTISRIVNHSSCESDGAVTEIFRAGGSCRMLLQNSKNSSGLAKFLDMKRVHEFRELSRISF